MSYDDIKSRIINSHWVIFNILIGYNGFSLIYAGLKSNTPRWIYEGLICEIPFIIYAILRSMETPPFSNIMVLLKMFEILSVFVTLFISLLIRKKYLEKIEQKNNKYNMNTRPYTKPPETKNSRLLDI